MIRGGRVVLLLLLFLLLLLLLWYCWSRFYRVLCCFDRHLLIVLELYDYTAPSPTPSSRIHNVLSEATSVPQANPSWWKRTHKSTYSKAHIFHSRAGRPRRIRASDPEAPCQNPLVVQRAAAHPTYYLTVDFCGSMSAPLPRTPSNSHFVRRVNCA